MGILDILLMVTSVILIILSLLQSGKTGGLGSAFGGSDDLSLFADVKERGAEKTIANITMVAGIIFFVVCVLIRILG